MSCVCVWVCLPVLGSVCLALSVSFLDVQWKAHTHTHTYRYFRQTEDLDSYDESMMMMITEGIFTVKQGTWFLVHILANECYIFKEIR